MIERSGIIPVRMPKGGKIDEGVSVARFKITALFDDHVEAHTWNGEDEGTQTIKIAKPYLLRLTPWDDQTRDSITYAYIDPHNRTATNSGSEQSIESLKEKYVVGDELWATDRPKRGTGVTLNPGEENEEIVNWLDDNRDGRRWHAMNEFNRPGVVYLCDDVDLKIYVLDPATLCVTCEVRSPGPNPAGIGGDKDILFHCDRSPDLYYKLDPDSLVTLVTLAAPDFELDSDPRGIGGATGDPDSDPVIPDVCYFSDADNDRVGTLNPSDLTVIAVTAGPVGSGEATGIGGDQNAVWHCDGTTTEQIFELDPDNLATVVRQGNAPGATPTGIGGTATTIWHCDRNADKIYEIDAINPGFAVLRTKIAPGAGSEGMGGS